MADTRKRGRCEDCDKVFPLSHRGLCRFCAWARSLEAVRQLRAKEGPIYEKYLRHWQASQERS